MKDSFLNFPKEFRDVMFSIVFQYLLLVSFRNHLHHSKTQSTGTNMIMSSESRTYILEYILDF